MMKQCLQETRLAYLLRVAIAHIRDHAAEAITEYDEAECDGACLADELQHELDALPSPPAPAIPAPPIRYRFLEIGESISAAHGDEYQLFGPLSAPEVPEKWVQTTRSGRTVTEKTAGSYRRPITSKNEHPEYAAGFMAVMMEPDAWNRHTGPEPRTPEQAAAAAAWEAGAEAARAIHTAKGDA